MQTQTNALTNSIYSCNWYMLHCDCVINGKPGKHHLSLRKSIFVMMERMKRPKTVTAGKVIPLTYDTFIVVRRQTHICMNMCKCRIIM